MAEPGRREPPREHVGAAGADSSAPEAEPAPADGLDLARQIARSLRGAGASSGRARRSRPGRAGTAEPAGRRGGSRSAGAQVSGARPDDRDPQLLDSTMDRLVADRGWEVDLRVHGVFGRWPRLVGAEIAEHATPESFADGRLLVRTDSTAWATQLKLLAPQLVRRLNEELGHDTVTLVDVRGPLAPSWKKGPRGLRDARGPRDTYG